MFLRRKNVIGDLAVFGGNALFDDALHVGRPNILDPDAFEKRVRGSLERRWLSNDGPLLLELERKLVDFVGAEHCVAVANATLGLQLVARALGLRRKVLMPSFTFIATAHAMEWEGAEPVFCDVGDDTHTVDPRAVHSAMTADVDAILAVHLWGRPCEVGRLQEIADERNVPLLLDAAHAMGSLYAGRPLGGLGRASVFSLHATKSINGIEGGFVATNDAGLAALIRGLRNYGYAGDESVGGLGINAKMSEISAAMALSNLPHYGRLAEHNRQLHAAYADVFAGVREITTFSPSLEVTSGHYAVFGLKPSARLTRDALIEVLQAERVNARRYFWPGCHRSEPYASRAQRALPVTEQLVDSVFQLPTGMQLDAEHARAIARCVSLAVQAGAQVTSLLKETRGAKLQSLR